MPRRRAALVTALTVLATLLVVGPLSFRAALHCDETNALRHISRFAAGGFGSPGRPGLLWLVSIPLAWLGPVGAAWGARVHVLLATLCCVVLTGLWGGAPVPSKGEPEAERGRAQSGGTPWPLVGWGAAVALLLSNSTWFTHAFEMRTDNYVAPLGLACAWVLYRRDPARAPWRSGALAGGLLGVMALISQKSIYNGVALALGLLAVEALGGMRRSRARLKQGMALCLVAAGSIGLWYLVMGALSGGTGDYIARQAETVARTAPPAISRFGMNAEELLGVARISEALVVGLALGLVAALARARRDPGRVGLLVYAGAMFGTMAFHRGFWLYFIASLLPPVAALAGAGLASLGARVERARPGRAAPLLALGLLVLAIALPWRTTARAWQRAWIISWVPQLQLMAEVEALFPEPVHYIDRIGLVTGYREVTHFGTAGNLEWFRARYGARGFIDRANETKPHFMVRNYMSRPRYFSPQERRWLWRHWLPIRQNLYLPGGRIRVEAESSQPEQAEIELLHDGIYTVHFWAGFAGRAQLTGSTGGPQPLSDGQQIELGAGRYVLEGEGGSGQVWLIHGADRRPEASQVSEVVDQSLFPLMRRARYQRYDRPGDPGDLLTPAHDTSLRRGRDREAALHRTFQERWDAREGNLARVALE